MTAKSFPLVHLKFWDHCTGPADTTEPLKCEVFGILKKETKQAYYVISWICEENLNDSNSDLYCILKCATISCEQLVTRSKKW